MSAILTKLVIQCNSIAIISVRTVIRCRIFIPPHSLLTLLHFMWIAVNEQSSMTILLNGAVAY